MTSFLVDVVFVLWWLGVGWRIGSQFLLQLWSGHALVELPLVGHISSYSIVVPSVCMEVDVKHWPSDVLSGYWFGIQLENYPKCKWNISGHLPVFSFLNNWRSSSCDLVSCNCIGNTIICLFILYTSKSCHTLSVS